MAFTATELNLWNDSEMGTKYIMCFHFQCGDAIVLAHHFVAYHEGEYGWDRENLVAIFTVRPKIFINDSGELITGASQP